MIREPLTLLLVFCAAVFASVQLERRTRCGRLVHAPVIAILLGGVLSNFGLVARSSPLYGAIEGPLVSLALVWLLLSVRLEHLRAGGLGILRAFALATCATMAAALSFSLLFAPSIGDQAWRLAGPLTGTYVGGSINFVALATALELDPSLSLAAIAADNIATSVWLLACMMLPIWLGRFYPAYRPPSGAASPAPVSSARVDVLELLGLGVAIVWLAAQLARWVPGIPAVLWLTSLALLCGRLRPIRALEGSQVAGTLALTFFFVLIGIYSRFDDVRAAGLAVLLLCGAIVVGHGLLVLVIGRFLRFDATTLAVASQAAVGGPSTAMAVANARGATDLILPGAAAGLLGYAVGTYAGYAVAVVVRALTN